MTRSSAKAEYKARKLVTYDIICLKITPQRAQIWRSSQIQGSITHCL